MKRQNQADPVNVCERVAVNEGLTLTVEGLS